MARHHLSVDLETFSSVDIKKAGLYKYVQSPDFEILLMAYSIDGGEVRLIDLTAPGWALPPEVVQALLDPETVKHAYNAAFEWYCLSKLFGMDDGQRRAWLPQWRCTMLHGLYAGYPAGLDAIGRALGLPQEKQKMSVGKALIRYFCVPCKPTSRNGGRTRNLPQHEPEKWKLFGDYCRQDVMTEQTVEDRLSPWPVPDDVQRQWETDMAVNARGVAVDLDLIRGALDIDAQQTGDLMDEARRLTGLANPKSGAQLRGWLAEQGVPLGDLQKQTVADALEDPDLAPDVRRVLEIRQGTSKASVAKYDAMERAVCADGRIRGLLQFYGANRTGRWAGRIVQVQNLPRTYLNQELIPMTRTLAKRGEGAALAAIFGSAAGTLSQLVRTAFVPKPGCRFVDADFSAIEARVIAWLSGEQWRLDVFRTHGKIYEASAAAMFGVPIESIAKGKENYGLRAKGKVAELALGYQGGAGALVAMGALRMGLSEDELPDIVQRWRGSNRAIVRLWREAEGAALAAVQTGRCTGAARCVFALEGDSREQTFLTITLPSGRKLFYAQPFLTENRFGGQSLGYWGTDQRTKKWGRLETYGGKLVENITQAVARDCLALAVERLEAAEYPVVFHIHDEVVIEIENDRANLDAVVQIMRQPPAWAGDLPLNADGWVGAYFTKD